MPLMICGESALESVFPLLDDFMVTTMPVPWDRVKGRFSAQPQGLLWADSMEESALEEMAAKAPDVSTVLALGGGRAVDLGKYVAWRRGMRLITVPSVLSVDAFVTPSAGIRRNGKVVYVGEVAPDPLVIDYTLLRSAPTWMNVAGIGDLLSIHTATFDWELAEKAGRSEYPFDSESVARARDVLAQVMTLKDALQANSNEGLQAIVDGYLRINELCLPVGHYRVEEGSEHYLFYELEERCRRPFVHGPIVGLGIALMSQLQGNRAAEIIEFMSSVGLPFQPGHLGLDRATLRDSLLALQNYVTAREDLWYTVIDEREIEPDWVDDVLSGLDFAAPPID